MNEQRSSLSDLADIERGFIVELRKIEARQAADLQRAEAERDAAFRAYDPADATPKATAPLERSTARVAALALQLRDTRAKLEGHRAELATLERNLLLLDAKTAADAAGMRGWELTHADEIERIRQLFAEGRARLRALAAKPIAPLNGDVLERAVALARDAGLPAPAPATEVEIASTLRHLMPPHDPFSPTEIEIAAVERLWRDLIARLRPSPAEWELLTSHEQAERIDREIRRENPEVHDAQRDGRQPRYRPAEYVALVARAAAWGRAEQARFDADETRNIAGDRVREFARFTPAEAARLVRQAHDGRRLIRLMGRQRREALLAAGLPASFVPADVLEADQNERAARAEGALAS